MGRGYKPLNVGVVGRRTLATFALQATCRAEMSSILRLGVGRRGCRWTGKWLHHVLRGRLYSNEAQKVRHGRY